MKPNERMVLGGAVVKNGPTRTVLIVENEVPILRERDILTPQTATTPCGMIYLAVQLMYVDPENAVTQRKTYASLVEKVLEAAPSTNPFIKQITDDVNRGRYYYALKTARELLKHEHTLLDHVANRT